MGNNEKMTNYHISNNFCPVSDCFGGKPLFDVLSIFTEIVMNFHKIFNQTGVSGCDSAACKNEIYQFLQML